MCEDPRRGSCFSHKRSFTFALGGWGTCILLTLCLNADKFLLCLPVAGVSDSSPGEDVLCSLVLSPFHHK